eukprot:11218696-Lingulodinium_polyedra.AAC.1
MGVCPAVCCKKRQPSGGSTSSISTQLAFPGLVEPTRVPSAPHWSADGSCSQLSPTSGELKRRWPTYELTRDNDESDEAIGE